MKGNPDADMAVRAAVTAAHDNISVPHSDFRQNILQYYKSKWQTTCESQIDNKLHKVKPNNGITYFRH